MNLRSSMIYAITDEFTNECEKQISSFLPIAFIHSIVHLLCPKIYPENFPSGFHHQSFIARVRGPCCSRCSGHCVVPYGATEWIMPLLLFIDVISLMRGEKYTLG